MSTVTISAADINKLRQATGAGMLDCRKALTETNGDFEAAIDWLRQNTKPGDRILAIEELAILPSEWKRLPTAPTLITWRLAVALLQTERFDYMIGSEFELRFVDDPQGVAQDVKRWTAAVSSLPVATTFGILPNLIVPGVWRSNDERIIIMRGAPAEVTPP